MALLAKNHMSSPGIVPTGIVRIDDGIISLEPYVCLNERDRRCWNVYGLLLISQLLIVWTNVALTIKVRQVT